MNVREAIDALLQLCSEDPGGAVAARHDVLPLHHNEFGWVCVTLEGAYVFIDDATARMARDVPDEWVSEAREAGKARYPELDA